MKKCGNNLHNMSEQFWHCVWAGSYYWAHNAYDLYHQKIPRSMKTRITIVRGKLDEYCWEWDIVPGRGSVCVCVLQVSNSYTDIRCVVTGCTVRELLHVCVSA